MPPGNRGLLHEVRVYKQINWIASYPKSGNTWVRSFLQAYYTGEIDINNLSISIQDDQANIHSPGTGVDITKAPFDIQQLMRPAALLRVVDAYNRTGAPIPLYIKTHTPIMLTNGIELLPLQLTKSVAYIVRDPRDVLPSFAKHMGVDIDQALEYMTDKYRSLRPTGGRVFDFLSSWGRHANSFYIADTHNVRIWRYEDLRANPHKHFAEILSHYGVMPDPARVERAVDLSDLQNLRNQERKSGFIEASPHAKNKFFGSGEVGVWRDKLTPKQAHTIEKTFGRAMKQHGYLLNRKVA